MSNSTNQHQDPAKNDAPKDPVSPSDEVMDDEDEEFEDVLPTGSSKINGTQEIPTETALWTPTLSLPPQRTEPIAPGSEEENQLRGRVSEGIDRINYLEMRARMSMDTPETPANERGYGSFAHLCRDVEALVDLLWASATRKLHRFIPQDIIVQSQDWIFLIQFLVKMDMCVRKSKTMLMNNSLSPSGKSHQPSRDHRRSSTRAPI